MVRMAALITCIAVLVSACEEMTPGQNAAVFGTGAGFLAANIANAAGASPLESLIIGAAAGAIVGMTAYVISKHQATERQRRIAEERARVYYGHLARDRRVAMKKKHARYIAVDTEKSPKAAPQVKKSVMIWDTQSESVVGNTVYDVQSTPAVGGTAKFDNYSAEYVGGGGH